MDGERSEALLSSGATARVSGGGSERAVVLVNGGRRREVPGDWSATLEWLVSRLAPELRELSFLEVRYRVKSWQRLDACVEDCLAAIGCAEELGARRVLLLGFSMGGAVAIAAAGHPLVTGVVGLAPWIPERLDVSGLDGKRIEVVHGSLDGVLPGVAGVSPSRTLVGLERIRARGVEVGHTLLSGGLHGTAVRTPFGGLVPLPRARRYAALVEAELRRFADGPAAPPTGA